MLVPVLGILSVTLAGCGAPPVTRTTRPATRAPAADAPMTSAVSRSPAAADVPFGQDQPTIDWAKVDPGFGELVARLRGIDIAPCMLGDEPDRTVEVSARILEDGAVDATVIHNSALVVMCVRALVSGWHVQPPVRFQQSTLRARLRGKNER